MPKPGTRKSTILKRRAATSARQTRALRMAAMIGGGALLLIWGGLSVANSAWPGAISQKVSAGVASVTAAQGWQLDRVVVEGRSRITAQQLQQALNVERGMPILFYDLQGAAQRVSSIGWVRDVQLERRLPDTLVVNIVERQPVALWRQDNGRIQVIDTDGVVVSPVITPEFKDLLLVQGNTAPGNLAPLLTALQAQKELAGQVDQAHWVGGRRWDLVLRNGVTVKLPEAESLQMALARVAQAQLKDDILNKPIDHVDVRDPVRVIVKPKSGTAGELQIDLVSSKQNPV